MHATWTIFRRELRYYFDGPVAYALGTAFLIISGFLYFSQVLLIGEASLRAYFEFTPLLFVFLVPSVAARTLAEEKHRGTLEMLITMPVTDWQVVLGKFFAAWLTVAVIVLLTLPYTYTISRFGDLDGGATTAGYLGLILVGGAYTAIGVMVSSWTRTTTAAYIGAFAITFAIWIAGKILPIIAKDLAPVVSYLSIDAHFGSIAKGILDTRDIVYFLSLIGGSLFLAVQSLDSRRWR